MRPGRTAWAPPRAPACLDLLLPTPRARRHQRRRRPSTDWRRRLAAAVTGVQPGRGRRLGSAEPQRPLLRDDVVVRATAGRVPDRARRACGGCGSTIPPIRPRAATLTLLVSGPVGTPDSPSVDRHAERRIPGPQMFDNMTVNRGGRAVIVEDVGGQAYLGGVWVYDIATGGFDEGRPARPGPLHDRRCGIPHQGRGVVRASSPPPSWDAGWYLLDVQAHYAISWRARAGRTAAGDAHPAGRVARGGGDQRAGRNARPAPAPT